ncbi:ArsB/NhaD family transporter [Microbacterium sp. zg-Y818]|uniref:SLC13 family permease n=1 Tax=unclassified Microbacterium TaxID=2609290 RepID=UPI00214C8404|nr:MULTISPECIES: SLC13 family permease [unclassified Microbacterium]MCR2800862.1 SLC13 family permease [Microbacterium sp. zg.Y818]WIM23888.1 ArsB/NhaD family transporter [Microbacterium sp. zg-Y818]
MDAVKLAVIGAVLLLLGGAAVALGVLPVSDALAVADRVWPILLFVVAVTIVAELAASAGVFDVVAARLARLARGRTIVLWLAVVGLAVIVTAFLSLDTTAVLLTPVVVAVARANGLAPLPFAFTTVWLANTGSLLLPVSNLTNLLAAHRIGTGGPGDFVALMWPSALVAVVVTVLLLLVVHRRDLRGRYTPSPAPRVSDPVLLRAASVIVVVLLPMLISGLPPWQPALAAAVALAIVHGWRNPRALGLRLLPWQLVVFASGLFLAVGALESWGAAELLRPVVGAGDGVVELLRVAGAGLIAANAIDNLPAYLALESVADSPARLGALLVGVNAGPLVTPWASLATLLWHERLRADGIDVPWRRYMLRGAVAAPVIVGLAVLPLAL